MKQSITYLVQQALSMVFLLSISMYANADVGPITSQTPWYTYCSSTPVAAPSAYSQNVNAIFQAFGASTSQGRLFLNYGSGTSAAEAAQATYYCRPLALPGGGFDRQPCQACVSAAQQELSSCTGNEAITWFPECTVRVANHNIYGAIQTKPAFWFLSNQTYDPPASFDGTSVFGSAIQQASQDDDLAYGQQTVQIDQNTKYVVLAQCSADIAGRPCFDCLTEATKETWSCCNKGRAQGAVLFPSCRLIFGVTMPLTSAQTNNNNSNVPLVQPNGSPVTPATNVPNINSPASTSPSPPFPSSTGTPFTSAPGQNNSKGVSIQSNNGIKMIGFAIAVLMLLFEI